MPTAEYDLRYLQAGVELLEKYLLSTDLYWPIGASSPAGEPPYPQLTLGSLLLAQKRLQAKALSGATRAAWHGQFEDLERQLDTLRSRWRVAWGQKASAEFRSRLNLWRNFLEDYRENPQANVDRYAYEVTRRALLHLLQPEAEDLKDADLQLLQGLDRLLRGVLVAGEFVWDDDLKPGFPQDVYWYLYGKPKS